MGAGDLLRLLRAALYQRSFHRRRVHRILPAKVRAARSHQSGIAKILERFLSLEKSESSSGADGGGERFLRDDSAARIREALLQGRPDARRGDGSARGAVRQS